MGYCLLFSIVKYSLLGVCRLNRRFAIGPWVGRFARRRPDVATIDPVAGAPVARSQADRYIAARLRRQPSPGARLSNDCVEHRAARWAAFAKSPTRQQSGSCAFASSRRAFRRWHWFFSLGLRGQRRFAECVAPLFLLRISSQARSFARAFCLVVESGSLSPGCISRVLTTPMLAHGLGAALRCRARATERPWEFRR